MFRSPPNQRGDDKERLRQMVDTQIKARGVTDERVLEAMSTVPRREFIVPDMQSQAYDDRPVPIGSGQTISQPYMVAYMTELLDVRPESIVLEIGTGSGYQCAVLAHVAKHVYTVEFVEELHRHALDVFTSLGLTERITAVCGDGSLGLPEYAPFDRILVTAGAPVVPDALINQLAPGGVLIAPVGGEDEQRIMRYVRENGGLSQTEHLACRFVKLLGQQGWEV